VRGRWWLLLFYAPLATGLCLATGDRWWLHWAFLIALVPTSVVILSGHSRDGTARRRIRGFSELADRIGARDGEVIRETHRRYNVIGFDPGLTVTTLYPGTEEEVRRVLFAKAAEAGFGPGKGWSMHSEDYRLGLHIGFPEKFHTGARWEPVPDGHVVTEIHIEGWKGGRPGDKPVARRRR
jgi:hypothetical protein